MTKTSGARRSGAALWLSLTAAMVFYIFAAPAQATVSGGGASWYSLPGNRTANGETMNPNAMTAAHRTLPFGTKVEVKNLRNGRTVVVRINDRGPFVRGRVIDVSRAAAQRLGFVRAGVARVQLRVVARPASTKRAKARRARHTSVATTKWGRWLNNLAR